MFRILVVVCVLAFQVNGTALNNTELVPSSKRATKPEFSCGGTFTCSNGWIVFSPEERIPDNLRCQYILSASAATQYTIKAAKAGFLNENNRFKTEETVGLVVSVLNYDQDGIQSFRLTNLNEPVTLTGHSIIVTFWSTRGAENTEFILAYESSALPGSNIEPASLHSEYSILRNGETHSHPSKQSTGSDQHGHRELSVIAMDPPNHILNINSRMEAEYQKITPSEATFCSLQKVEYFTFNVNLKRFESAGQICDDVSSKRMLLLESTILVVTSSRSFSDPKRGFTLKYLA